MTLEINPREAQAFLSLFSEDEVVTFQYFSDNKKEYVGSPEHFTGSIEESYERLAGLNAAGNGVFFMVNEGDGGGRDESNVRRVRALFLDLDGSPLDPVTQCGAEPHAIVESSPGRYQVFWLVDGCPLEKFSPTQKAMAERFRGDPTVCDLPRVMRVPGFWHRKATPFRSRTIRIEAFQPYQYERFVAHLQLAGLVEKHELKSFETLAPVEELEKAKIREGGRHTTLTRYACKYAFIDGFSLPELRIMMRGLARHYCEPPYEDMRDVEKMCVSGLQYAAAKKNRIEEIDLSEMLRKAKLATASNGFDPLPDKFYSIPGLVGETFRYVYGTNIKPQPELSLAAALAACATAMGRKVRTETDLRTNLYFLCLVESGAGKDAPRAAVKRLFEAVATRAGNPDLSLRADVEDVTSDAAILEALQRCESQVFLLDEFGRFLRTTKDPSRGGWLYNVPTLLMRLYTSASEHYGGKNYADSKFNRKVVQPNLSVLATSTGESFYKSISKDAVTDGLLGRMIFVQSSDPDPDKRERVDRDPPDSLVEEFLRWERRQIHGGNLAQGGVGRPQPSVVGMSREAKAVFRDFEADLRKVRSRLRPEQLHALYSRTEATAIQVAMVIAGGRDFDAPRIEIDDAQLACEFVLICTNNLLRAVREHVSDTQFEAHDKAIELVIRNAGEAGISKSAFGDATRYIDPRIRDAVVRRLKECEVIVEKSLPTGGRPVIKYIYVKDLVTN